MFDENGNISKKAWRNMFVIGMGITSLGGAAQFWPIALVGITVMLYTGWYYIKGE
jgi:hypothetical protein